MLIICGPSCVGKTTFGSFAASSGITAIEGSDSVKRLFAEQKLDGEDVIDFCHRLYAFHGRDVFARATVSRMKAEGVDPNRTVFVGCRTVEEVEFLREWSGGSVVGLHADTSIRFKRCVARGRPNKALRLEDFVKQDMRELEMGLARVLGAAVDRFLINEGSLLDFEALAQIEIRKHIGKSK